MHSLEWWLTVLTSVGLLTGGYCCLLARAINSACRIAADPDLWYFEVYQSVRGGPTRGQRLARWMALHTNAGAWPSDRLSLAECTAAGMLAGATFGFLGYAAQSLWTGTSHDRRSGSAVRTIGSMSAIPGVSATQSKASEPRNARWLRLLAVVSMGAVIAAAADFIGLALHVSGDLYSVIAIAVVIVVVGVGVPIAALGDALHAGEAGPSVVVSASRFRLLDAALRAEFGSWLGRSAAALSTGLIVSTLVSGKWTWVALGVAVLVQVVALMVEHRMGGTVHDQPSKEAES